MDLILKRDSFGEKSTVGTLSQDGEFICDTMEDKMRQPPQWEPGDQLDWKIPGETAIPTGRYPIKFTYSDRFQRTLPLLLNVPGFAGIRIHPGNTAEDTEGCILPGMRITNDFVAESRVHFKIVYQKIQDAFNQGKQVWITVSNGP